MAKVFRTQLRIKFREADPAQIMYFGQLFNLAHDCFEEFIVDAGYVWSDWFRKGELMVPIRRAEADYLAPFVPGQTYNVEVRVAEIRQTSFRMHYRFFQGSKLHAEVSMVHAVLRSADHSKLDLPPEMRSRLEVYWDKA